MLITSEDEEVDFVGGRNNIPQKSITANSSIFDMINLWFESVVD